MTQIWEWKAAPNLWMSNTILLPSGDQKGSKAAVPGATWVSCRTSKPSGFIVEMLQQPPLAVTNAIRPLAPGNVACAVPPAATSQRDAVAARVTITISRLMATPPFAVTPRGLASIDTDAYTICGARLHIMCTGQAT